MFAIDPKFGVLLVLQAFDERRGITMPRCRIPSKVVGTISLYNHW